MKLATKLSLFVGILLLLICVMVYFLPIYVAKRQAADDRDAYLNRLEAQLNKEWDDRFDWLVGEMSDIEATIDAFLYLTATHPELFKVLHKGAEGPGIWLPLAQLLNYSDKINFLQAKSKDGRVAAITLANPPHYWSYEKSIDQSLSWVTLSSRRWTNPATWARIFPVPEEVIQYELLGIRLPLREAIGPRTIVIDEENLSESWLFLLFDPEFLYDHPDYYKELLKPEYQDLSFPDLKDAGKAMTYLLEQLARAQEMLQKQFKDKKALQQFLTESKAKAKKVPTASPLEEGAIGVKAGGIGEKPQEVATLRLMMEFLLVKMRARELDMAAAMGLFTSMGVVWETPLDKGFATGAAHINPKTQQGGGVFAKDIFSVKSLFDEQTLFKTHPPFKMDVPISTGFGLVSWKDVRNETIANVAYLTGQEQSFELFGSDGFLSLGISIDPTLRELRTITGMTSILIEGTNVAGIAFAKEEEKQTSLLNAIKQKAGEFNNKSGFIVIGDDHFYYSRYVPRPDWDLAFVTLAPAKQIEEPYTIFKERSQLLMHKISLYTLLISIAIFILALSVLIALTKHFTRPISALAEATGHIAEGKYEAVKLPKMPSESNNEIAVLTHAFSKMVQGLSDKAKMRSVLDKVVSKEIANEILKGTVHLGGEVKEVAVLFADIRRFTELTEHLPPEQTIAFINSYMTEMTRVIEEHQGVIDKYVGDEVMALYGAPLPHRYSALQAVVSALLIRDRLKKWNVEREARGEITASVGIGINCGEMVAGNMGAEDRLNYTVLGANVNLASRLCEHAAPMEILIPKSMAKKTQIAEYIDLEEKGTIELEGFSKPIEMYRVKGLLAPHTLESISKMVTTHEA